jgi:hypothetical protein
MFRLDKVTTDPALVVTAFPVLVAGNTRELDRARVPAVTVATRTCGEFLTITTAEAFVTVRPQIEVALKITPVAAALLIVTPLVHCKEQPVISK